MSERAVTLQLNTIEFKVLHLNLISKISSYEHKLKNISLLISDKDNHNMNPFKNNNKGYSAVVSGFLISS